jgi:hypothetical protein
MELQILLSDSKTKRLKALLRDNQLNIKQTIHFGSKDGQTYIDHGDKTKRENYIKRHQALNEDWNSINAGSLSRYILWGQSTDINKNINDYKKKFRLI